MTVMKGTIEAMSRDGKRFKLEEDGKWYSAFSAAQMGKAARGDSVVFSYTSRANPSGDPFLNVKGNVDVVNEPFPVAGSVTPSTGAVPKNSSPAGGKWAGRQFPVGPLDPERSIIRQNSLGHATEMVNFYGTDAKTSAECAAEIIEIARMFEAYSAGDLDREIADEAVKLMLAEEVR